MVDYRPKVINTPFFSECKNRSFMLVGQRKNKKNKVPDKQNTQ